MRLVIDTLFLETLEFRMATGAWNQCSVAPSREESLREAMETVGLELIDYGSFTAVPIPYPHLGVRVSAYSRAYRERAERAAALR